MPLINVTKSFKHSNNGNEVIEYNAGEHEVSDRCAEIAVNQLKVANLVESEETKAAKLEAEKAAKLTQEEADKASKLEEDKASIGSK